MAQLRRVAITGLGAICGNGHNLEQIWQQLINGQSGISELDHADELDINIKFGGQVKDFQLNYDVLSEKEAPRYDRFIHLTMTAGYEDLMDSKVLESNYDRHRIGWLDDRDLARAFVTCQAQIADQVVNESI